MKILAIGDLHGKTVWRRIVQNVDADRIVFIGDYVNAKRWIGDSAATDNLENLITFKRHNADKVDLLIGNHDLYFLHHPSLARRLFFPKMSQLFQRNADSFSLTSQFGKCLFIHAGVSNSWVELHPEVFMNVSIGNLATALNSIYNSERQKILFEKGMARGGSFAHGGPIFADKSETQNDCVPGVMQIVGHTKVPRIHMAKSNSGSIIYIDCLNTVQEFLLIDGDNIEVINERGKKLPLSGH